MAYIWCQILQIIFKLYIYILKKNCQKFVFWYRKKQNKRFYFCLSCCYNQFYLCVCFFKYGSQMLFLFSAVIYPCSILTTNWLKGKIKSFLFFNLFSLTSRRGIRISKSSFFSFGKEKMYVTVGSPSFQIFLTLNCLTSFTL